MSPFLVLSLIGFGASVLLTYAVRACALRFGIVDKPGERKVHEKPMPLLGGLAVYGALVVALFAAIGFGYLPQGSIVTKHLVGLMLGGFWLALGGFLDDKYNLPPQKQILWPVLAVLTVIASGIGIESITAPWGGQWFLHQINITLFYFGGLPYKLTLLSDVFTFVWLMIIIYATKFFDGLDGLVSGLTVIGSLVICLTSLLPKIHQPETALVACVVAACFAGFLLFNFHPASIFLGEAGSTIAGFLMGTLAIISESKVVTTLVVMALPFLDLFWVLIRRAFIEKTPIMKGDRKHIHHRLLASGFSHRNAVLVLYLWAIVLGLFAYLYQGQSEWFVLVLSWLAIFAFAFYLVKSAKRV